MNPPIEIPPQEHRQAPAVWDQDQLPAVHGQPQVQPLPAASVGAGPITQEIVSLPGEPPEAFDAFLAYLHLGRRRTLSGAARLRARGETTINRWSKRWNWQERAAALDGPPHALKTVVSSNALPLPLPLPEAGLHASLREAAQLESEWQSRCEALALAREAIARWKEDPEKSGTLEGIARMLTIASKLGRLATNMASDHFDADISPAHGLTLEIKLAIEKAYGRPVPPEFSDPDPQLPFNTGPSSSLSTLNPPPAASPDALL